MLLVLALLQTAALAILAKRLSSGRHRRPPVVPVTHGEPRDHGTVSVIVPTYNEAARVGPCLQGLASQGAVLREVIVVDSRSADGTDDLVRDASARDARVRLEHDPPLPQGWVGKVWALQHGLERATGDWVLGVDADTAPRPGMVAAVVQVAREMGYDVVSFSPRFAGMTAWEQWLQPSMLLTLIYRSGAAGDPRPAPDRVLANGQCFLARRAVLLQHGGYALARESWADDVTLARALARRGSRVGFLDGSRLYDVRAYTGAAEMWREWGRSFDLSDTVSPLRQWADVAFIGLVQVMPWVVLALAAGSVGTWSSATGAMLIVVSLLLVAIRVLMLGALATSYERPTAGYWLSPLSDPLAWIRLVLSTLRRPLQWRGRRCVGPVEAGRRQL